MPVLTEILEAQRNHLASGATLPLAARRAALGRLEYVLAERETLLLDALQADLGKSHFEGYETELGMVYAELHDAQKHLARWMRPKTVSTPLAHFPSKSRIYPEPYGTALILSPWNYPVQLCLAPLVGALAAGCCAVVKPSNYAPATSAALAEVLAEAFPPERVAVVTGGRAENQSLLEQKFDKIFFTGGVKVGRLVMESAARNLTPVTLELGGKSPCLLDHTANLELAAVRLAWGKTLNSGQTCVAPDYLLIEQSVRDRFLPLLRDAIVRLYGEAPLRNSQYGRIVNQKHFDRLRGLLEGETVYCGGRFDERARKIEPTVLVDVQTDAPVMQEEIFGPLLPVLTWRSLDEAIAFVNARPKPLALYLFTEDRRTEQTIRERVSFGGGCVNDTIVHLANPRLPFGGVGESGMGSYHGKRSFDEFTHYKSVLKKSTRLDIGLRYPPYNDTKYAWLRRFF